MKVHYDSDSARNETTDVMTDARMHYDMAMRMAVDLGMTNSSINLIGDQRDIRVLTWSNLVELHHACELQHRLRFK